MLLHVGILAFDALFALIAVFVVAWSTRSSWAYGATSIVPSPREEMRTRVPKARADAPRSEQPAGLLVETLVRMGFKRAQAERAAAEIRAHGDAPLDVQVREALRVLT